MPTNFNGQVLIQPQAATAFSLQGLTPANPPGPYSVALIGPANQGPNSWQTVASPSDIVSLLGADSDLANAAARALAPSPVTPGANPLRVYNVNPTTVGTLTLDSSGGSAAINATTTRYGQAANQISVAVAAGALAGYTLTVADGYSGQSATLANCALNGISIYYSGTGTSPTYTVSDTQLVLTATTSDIGGTIAFSTTGSLTQLVTAVNQLSGWNAAVLDPNAADNPAAFFDNVGTAAPVSTSSASPTALSANVTAAVRALNSGSQPWITATRASGATNLATGGAAVAATGGSTGTATSSDWQAAYTALQQHYDVLWAVPVSSSPTYWAMNQAHCVYMAGIGFAREGIVGGAVGTTASEAQANAASLASAYTGYLVNGVTGTNLLGQAATFPPYIAAAQLAGLAAGQPLNDSLTNKPVQATGLEQAFADSTLDALVSAGCLVLKQGPYSSYPVVVKGQTTAALNPESNADQIQLSAMTAQAVLVRLVNAALQPFVGSPIRPTTAQEVAATVFRTLRGATATPLLAQPVSAKQISVSISGTVITVTVSQVALTLPADFALTTLAASVDAAQAA